LSTTITDYLDKYPHALVRDLLWSRNYHRMLVREIDRKLIEISKKHGIAITLDE